MVKKQMKKLAQEIYACEKIHESPNSSKEEKSRAVRRIMQISNQVMALEDGINILFEIDAMAQSMMDKEQEKEN